MSFQYMFLYKNLNFLEITLNAIDLIIFHFYLFIKIMMHLFCTYLDTHLPSNPRYADGKSFSGLHFIKSPAKPGKKGYLKTTFASS